MKEASQYWANNTVCIECNKKAWRARATPESRKRWGEHQKKADDLNIARYLLRQARKRAIRKGLECTIVPSDIHVPDVCPIFGVPMVKNRGRWQNNSFSLDRVDSSKGYVKGNVRVISWWANNLKSNMTIEQVDRLLKYMKKEI